MGMGWGPRIIHYELGDAGRGKIVRNRKKKPNMLYIVVQTIVLVKLQLIFVCSSLSV